MSHFVASQSALLLPSSPLPLSTQHPPRLASFDIFDTVLTRAIGSPEANFLLLGNWLRQRGSIDCSAEVFARQRAEAETRAFQNAGGLDSTVGLPQIYAELGTVLQFTSAQIQHLIELELAHEQQMLRLVPQAADIVKAARIQQQQIAYLSDMYLDPVTIEQYLTDHQLYEAGDRCLVSSSYAKSKASGALFQTLLQQTQLAPDQVTHCGNNSWADVRQAAQVGLKVQPFYQGNLNRYEEILESQTWATGGLTSALAGASRLTRLSIAANSPREAALRDVTAGVAAPMLTGFVLWVLKRAKQLGLKRLYFVSRDGQILLEMAHRLMAKLDMDCELRYLYGSRQAWLLPSITTVDEEHLAGIFTGNLNLDVEFVSVELALARLNMSPEEIASSLDSIHLTAQDWQRNLNPQEREALTQLVLHDRAVQQVVLHKASEARQPMLRYLEQEGLLESLPYGLVDLGTGATLHYALSSVLDTANHAPPTSFYLGLRGAPIEDRFGRPEAYLFDRRLNLGYFNVDGMNELFESTCSADHGTVLGYQAWGDRVEPILKAHNNQPLQAWGFALVRQALLTFADQLLLDPDKLNPWIDIRSDTVALVTAFWQTPAAHEAEAWGAFPMEDGWGEQSFYHCFARPYTWQQTWRALWHGEAYSRRHWWHQGAMAITPARQQAVLKFFLKVGRKQRSFRQQLQIGQRLRQFLR